jgi:hypothetical protein
MLTKIKTILNLPKDVEKLRASNQSLKSNLSTAMDTINAQASLIKALQTLVGEKRNDGWDINNYFYTWTATNSQYRPQPKAKELTLVEKVQQIMDVLELKEERTDAKAAIVKVVKKAPVKKAVAKKGKR